MMTEWKLKNILRFIMYQEKSASIPFHFPCQTVGVVIWAEYWNKKQTNKKKENLNVRAIQ